MTNKPMLSVDRELLERAASAIEKHHGSLQWVIASDLRAIIDKPVNFLTPDCPDCACVQDGQCLCIPSKPAAQHQGEPVAKYAETVPKFKFETLVEHCKRLESDLAQSRARVNEITLYQENAVWFWQHDGEDYLQSLSCPIIIQPHHLRELLEGKAQHNPLAEQPAPVALTVWYGSMPESNGKTNWTAILHRKGEPVYEGTNITLDRSEYPDRVRYEADRARYLIGELAEEPDILAYDEKLHSGYVKPEKTAPVAVVMPERMKFSSKASDYAWAHGDGWNDCLAEVARLNGVKP